MGMALYQKYRPRIFADVYGQDSIVKALKNAILFDRLSHAYIFAGPRGIGKTTFAKIFAKTINCLSPKDGDSCNKCANCTLINNSNVLDLIELDAASNNGVDEIRTLIENINYQPVQLVKKVYILDEAHMLTNGAWNALLKTLEDCPSHVIFIFATTEPHKIPLTIVSRCQSYFFQRFNKDLIRRLLDYVCKQEKIDITGEAIQKIVELSDGSARDALSILDQCCSFSDTTIEVSFLEHLFGLIDDKKKINLFKFIRNNDVEKVTHLINEFNESGVDYAVLINDLLLILADCFLYDETKNSKLLKKITANEIAELKIDKKFLMPLIDIFLNLQIHLKSFSHFDSAFEFSIFKCVELFSGQKSDTNIVFKNEVNDDILSTDLSRKDIIDKIKTNPEEKIVEIKDKKTSFDNISVEKIFISLAIDHDISVKKKYESKLNELKKIHWSKIDNNLKILCDAEKVLLGANNGFVLLFKDKVTANLINANILKKNFVNAINDFFNKPLFVIGVDKQTAKIFTKKFKEYGKNKQDYELDLNEIEVLLKKSNLAKVDFVKKYFKKIILI